MAEVVAETERLRLREWDEEDEARFYAIMNTAGGDAHLGGVQTPEEWRAAFERVAASSATTATPSGSSRTRTAAKSSAFAGLSGSMRRARASSPASMRSAGGCARARGGKGIAKEAAIASLDLAFDRFGCAARDRA